MGAKKPEQKKSLFKKIMELNLFTKIMIGFALGIIAGLVLQEEATMFAFLGTILVNLLQMIVAPLIFCVIVGAIANIGEGNNKKLGRIGLKTVMWFLGTTAIAIVIGLFFANLLNVGTGVTIPTPGDTTEVMESAEEFSVVDTIVNIVPVSIFEALAENSLLSIIFFALLLGFSTLALGEDGKKVRDFFNTGQNLMTRLTEIVLEFTPIGVFGLMADVVGSAGLDILLPYSKAIFALFLACILFLVIVQAGILVGGIAKISPIRFLREMKDAMAFAFATCSSVATLPLTLKATLRLGADKATTNFAVPLGSVINMNGTAIYQAVSVIFVAQIYGIELSITTQLMVMLTATLASIGTAGVPGSGLIMSVIVLQAAGLPLEGVALLAGIDRIMNMGRIVPNIVGDAATALLVSKSEGTLHVNKLKENKTAG
ncbi:dicarboxylate/amino acid:cation symporter [Oceanobacillus kimchii]|uniref:dicarboxylate/amino acid:cation symporter n=1 Tax=Oceanobacillus kimchii TaxID=746691 RepID=UPI001589ECDF|nr:dicarboxylate/amino acid:cation symporter [Oceanobacillus kimchii]